jgi:hypothetical protein
MDATVEKYGETKARSTLPQGDLQMPMPLPRAFLRVAPVASLR